MARTTTKAVEGVLAAGKDYDTKIRPSLIPYIDAASSMVDDVVDCASAKGVVLSAAKKEIMERWLAAHFYAISDKPYASKSTEGASASFHGQTGMYGEATLYGQTAMRLDPSNCLAAILGGKVAGGFWAGKNPPSQIDYKDRP